MEYKRPAGAYPLRNFQTICRVSTPFQDALGIKISLDFLKRLWSYAGFNLRGLVTPKFSAPPSGENTRKTPKVLEVQERARGPLSPCQVWWGSDFTRRRGSHAKTLIVQLCKRCTSCGNSVCLSVYHTPVLCQNDDT